LCGEDNFAHSHQLLLRDSSEKGRVCRSTLLNILEMVMSTGTVKWFNPTKGYGFIQPQGGGQDVFVHISAVERAGLSTLNEGQQVEYEIVSNRGKSSAENLKVK
jgi:CspA family cold shock protein